jgi:S1-C subfamily serine protease
MANALKELSASLREAVRKASGYTVGLEREPYSVSGVLIAGDRVLTASHLVPDEGITVTLPDGKKAEAKVAGRDHANDLALLRLSGAGGGTALKPAQVAVGDLVVSLKRDSVDGINAGLAMVSAAGGRLRMGRGGVMESYIQTDADRMPGSTGGPLADADGAFAGIQVFNRRMGAEVAIPADLALERAKLLEKGNIAKPYLGVKSQTVEVPQAMRASLKGQEAGLLLVWVEADGPAEKAGLTVGDILVRVGGAAVADQDDLLAAMAQAGAGSSVEAEIIHGGALKKVPLALGSR